MKPTIVCLCGSTKFHDTFARANLELTLAGKIVLSIGCHQHQDHDLLEHLSPEQWQWVKAKLEVLHLAKIDLADAIFVLNVGGYIGESTRREIVYARTKGKRILYLETEEDDPTANSNPGSVDGD